MNFNLVNVVYYDGCNAYVDAFVLPCSEDNKKVSSSGIKKIKDYINGNGEILKLDILYPVTLENINAYRDDETLHCIYDRFDYMFF